MLDLLLDGMKGQVIDKLKESTGLDAGQAEQAVPLAKESITEGLTSAVTGGNISGLMNMFSGGGDGLTSNPVYKMIADNFIGKLTSSIGIPASMAGTVSSMALPMLLNKIKGEASSNDGSVDQAGIMNMLGMNSDSMMDNLKDKAGDILKGKLGDIGGGIGKLFG